jgi:hypothetical protein
VALLKVGQKETIRVVRLPQKAPGKQFLFNPKSTLTLKKRLTVHIQRTSAGEYTAKTSPEFGTGHIWVSSHSKVGIMREIADQLLWLKHEYGDVDDKELSVGAQQLKVLVNEYV